MRKSVAFTVAFLALAAPAAAQAPMMMSADQYRQMAMISDAFEIESSRLALSRSQNPAIRRYANMMVSDHGQTSGALMGGGRMMAGGPVGGAASGAATGAAAGGAAAGPVGAVVGGAVGAGAGAVAGTAGVVAGAAGYSAGPMLDARHADMLNQLAAARGAQFDRLYVQMQVQSHQEALALHSSYAQSGFDPGLRGFAGQAVPVIQEHLAMAQRLPGAPRARRG
jgi:predicted outer membrane protein